MITITEGSEIWFTPKDRLTCLSTAGRVIRILENNKVEIDIAQDSSFAHKGDVLQVDLSELKLR